MSIGNGVKREWDFDRVTPEPTEIKFRYRGERYALCDASHATARAYRRAVISTYNTLPDGTVVMGERLPETEAALLGPCIFRLSVDDVKSDKPVGADHVASWPNKVFRLLFQKCKEISMLDERELNSPEAIQKEIDRLVKLKELIEEDMKDGGLVGNSQGAGKESSASPTT